MNPPDEPAPRPEGAPPVEPPQPVATPDVEPPHREAEGLEHRLRRMSRRGFAVAGAAGLAGLAGWRWLVTRGEEGGLPWPFRRVLGFNERLAGAYFKGARLAPTFPREQARGPRVNGEIGLRGKFDPAGWKLRVETPARAGPPLELSLDEVRALPRAEMVTELKCVEGWSAVVHWAGVRLADFAAHYRLGTRSGRAPALADSPGDLLAYVGLETPGRDYYVGLDVHSALHPQTFLCYEMNGAPLASAHGAPLRLVPALKYGFKSLKRVGTLRFTGRRPPDYWAERGYDWYAGH